MISGIYLERCGAIIHLERDSELTQLKKICRPTLSMAWGWKLIGMLTGTALDWGSQDIGSSPSFGRSEVAVKWNGKGGWGSPVV
jgi:hypothetical protein